MIMNTMQTDILAIDDDEDTIEGLLSEFDLLGYTFEIAKTLADAKEKLRHHKYRMLLVDLRMKSCEDGAVADNGGLELIRKLRKGKFGAANQTTSYVMISAQQFSLDRLEQKIGSDELASIRAGRIARFSKGDSLTPLVRRIASVLEELKA